jgi:hypothetical protein
MSEKMRGILLAIGLFGLAAGAAGCGGNGNDLAQFTGTWEYTQSLVTLSCPGQGDLQGTLGSTERWGGGVSSDLVNLNPSIFDFGTQCFYPFDVKDKIATIQPAQTCKPIDVNGNPVDEAPTSWTFTLTSATTAVESLAANDMIILSGVPTDPPTACTLSGSATLKKVATD